MSTDANELTLQLAEVKKKSLLLIFLSFLSAFFYWNLLKSNLINNEVQHGVGWPMIICPFLIYFLYPIARSYNRLAQVLSYFIAISLGIVLGGISGAFERATHGIVIQAVTMALCSSVAIIYLYKNKWIKVNSLFLEITSYALSSLLLSAFVDIVMSYIDLNWRPMWSGSSDAGIAINATGLILGYLIFTIDLNVIDEKLSSETISKDQLWFYSLELLIDVAWIYAGLLFLLMRVRGKKNWGTR